MSDQATQNEGAAPTGEGQATNTTLEERLSQVEKTNQRLLAESKDYKTKYQTLKEEQEKKEKETLTQKEDWKKLLDQEREERAAERSKFKTFKHNTVSKLLEFEILKHAPDAQPEAIGLIKQSLPADMISAIEEDDEIKLTGVKEGIDKVKKEKTFLFKSQTVPQMMGAKPGSQNAQSLNGSAKTLAQMNSEEVIAYWKANQATLR